MAEILVVAVSASNADPEKDRQGCYKRGMPVQVMPDGVYAAELANPNSKMLPPKFFWILCPTLTQGQTDTLKAQVSKVWNTQLDYEVLASNNNTGVYQLRVFNVNTSVSNDAGLTQQGVENYLTDWGGVVNSFANNSVTFTINLWLMLQSNGFWKRDVSQIDFTLNNYDSASGVANVTADYTALTQTQYLSDTIDGAVRKAGGEVISNANGLITFNIERSVLIQAFRSDIKDKLDKPYMRRQFYFSSAQMDTVEGLGGVITVTPAQLANAVKDRLAD